MATLKRLASRGGRIRTSTRFPVFGASIIKRGLAPAPFFHFWSGHGTLVRGSSHCRGRPTLFQPRAIQQQFHGSTSVYESVLCVLRSCARSPTARSREAFCTAKYCAQKSERPVGGPAARAWGWRETKSEVSSVLPVVMLRSRAAVRHTGAVSTTPEAATNS